MTTIATDGKSMAGDSRGCANNVIRCDNEQKLYRLTDGRIIGFCGTAGAARDYIAWLEDAAGGDKPKIEDDFSALVLTPEGVVQVHCNCALPDNTDLPVTIGSGGAIALGAMLAGASPEEAVAISAQRDPFTGGKTTVLHLESACRAVA